MSRTKDRPLPSGHIFMFEAIAFSAFLLISGLVYLLTFVNLICSFVTLISAVIYLLIYTPLKTRSPLNSIIGAIPGAIPPLLGWVAATGEIGAGGMALFAILLVWQLPHFIAITLYLNSDYRRAGIRTVAVVRGEWAAKAQALAYATLLIPVSLLPVTAGLGGAVYTVIVLLAGMGFWYMGLIGFRKDVFQRSGEFVAGRSSWYRSLINAFFGQPRWLTGIIGKTFHFNPPPTGRV